MKLSAGKWRSWINMEFDEKISELTRGITDPKKRIETLLDEAYAMRRTDPGFTKQCSIHCLQESQKIGFKRGIAIALCYRGMAYYLEGEVHKALSSLDQSVALCLGNKNINTISLTWAVPLLRSYNLIGLIATDQGNFEQALTFLDNAHILANKLGDATQISLIRGNIANIHADLGHYPEAEKILQDEVKNLQDAQRELDPVRAASLFANLGRVLNLSGQLEKGESFLQQALDISRKFEMDSIQASILDELGNLELRRDNLDSAERYFRNAITLSQQNQDLVADLLIKGSLASVLLHMDKFQDAEIILQNAILAAEKEGLQGPLPKLILLQSQVFEKSGQTVKALAALKNFVELTTSVDGQKVIDNATQQELSRLRGFRNSIDKVWLIGSQIASLSDSDNALREMMKSIFDLTDADFIEIVLQKETGIEFLSGKKDQIELKSSFRPVNELQKLAILCITNGQEIMIQDLELDHYQFIDHFDPSKFEITPESPQTLLYFPLLMRGVPIGALSIQYRSKNRAASDMHISYRLLAQFVTIGLTNMNRLTEIKREKDILAEAASYDALTRLLNRRSIAERTMANFQAAKRQKFSYYVLLFDIDDFKSINDTLGHLAGDQSLKLVANHMRNVFKRASDHLGRYGGDEFTIMLIDTPKANVLSLAEKLRKEVEKKSYLIEQGYVHLTISMGISGRGPDEEFPAEVNAIFDEADKALYQAKKLGKNRFVFYGDGEE